LWDVDVELFPGSFGRMTELRKGELECRQGEKMRSTDDLCLQVQKSQKPAETRDSVEGQKLRYTCSECKVPHCHRRSVSCVM
jgi:hypothetical protein